MPLRIRYTIEQVIDSDENSTLDDICRAVKQKGVNFPSTMMLTTNGVAMAAGRPLADYIQDAHLPIRALDIYQTADDLCQVRVQNEGGHARDVLISIDGTIKDHKARIEEAYEISSKTQKLILDDCELSNDSELPDVIFTEDKALELKLRIPTDIHIDLQTVTGRLVPIATRNVTYVSELKIQIQEVEGIQPGTMRLYYHGQRLHDDNVLEYYGIKDWVVVSLFVATAEGLGALWKAEFAEE